MTGQVMMAAGPAGVRTSCVEPGVLGVAALGASGPSDSTPSCTGQVPWPRRTTCSERHSLLQTQGWNLCPDSWLRASSVFNSVTLPL